jgi:O-acetylserine/cysteine efflux transporter
MPSARLPAGHLLLALAVVAVWGSNFVVIKWALAVMPPFLLGFLRFAIALVPALLFVPRPTVRWPLLAAYGALIGAGQFGLLYLAIDGHIAPGLASLVIQTQVFFTIGLAMWADGERLRPVQALALALAVLGVVLIGVNTGGEVSALGLGLVLLAALSWAGGNQVARRMGRVDMLGVVVWSSAFALPPLALLTLLTEGPARIGAALAAADAATWAAVAWQAVGNTLFGYAAWGWLLARHPAGTIAPMALGVPVFGMASAAWWLAEPLPAWKLGAAALVIGGLVLNLLAQRRGP